jgi:hypothetical protein
MITPHTRVGARLSADLALCVACKVRPRPTGSALTRCIACIKAAAERDRREREACRAAYAARGTDALRGEGREKRRAISASGPCPASPSRRPHRKRKPSSREGRSLPPGKRVSRSKGRAIGR